MWKSAATGMYIEGTNSRSRNMVFLRLSPTDPAPPPPQSKQPLLRTQHSLSNPPGPDRPKRQTATLNHHNPEQRLERFAKYGETERPSPYLAASSQANPKPQTLNPINPISPINPINPKPLLPSLDHRSQFTEKSGHSLFGVWGLRLIP